MKKLLILGATTETMKMVETANRMGVRTYVVDPYPTAPAKAIASDPVELDCFDVEAVAALVEKEQIDGILPGCADVLIPVYEMLCRKAGKHCYVNEEAVKCFNNKKGLKQKLLEFGLPVVKEHAFDDVMREDFDAFPVFVKPVDNNSSKGMSVAYNRQEFVDAYEKALSFSKSQTVLIEEFKTCDDFNIGYFFQDGNVRVTFTADRYVNSEQPGVGTITTGMIYPSRFEQLYFGTTHEKMLALFRSLHMENGIMSIQGFIEDGKIMFYDPALRITGGQEYILSKHFYGLDVLQALVNFALTGQMGTTQLYECCDSAFGGACACNLAFSVRGGVIGSIDGIAYAKAHPNVINVTQEHFPGSVIDRIGTAQQNISRMHLVAENKTELKTVIKDLQKTVIAYDTQGSNMMLTGMDADLI